jgi:hypothetical protein
VWLACAGAAHVINYRRGCRRARQWTGGEACVVYGVGKDTWERSLITARRSPDGQLRTFSGTVRRWPLRPEGLAYVTRPTLGDLQPARRTHGRQLFAVVEREGEDRGAATRSRRAAHTAISRPDHHGKRAAREPRGIADDPPS